MRGQIRLMQIKLPTVAVLWNGPALIRNTQMRIPVWTDATRIITHHNAHCGQAFT